MKKYDIIQKKKRPNFSKKETKINNKTTYVSKTAVRVYTLNQRAIEISLPLFCFPSNKLWNENWPGFPNPKSIGSKNLTFKSNRVSLQIDRQSKLNNIFSKTGFFKQPKCFLCNFHFWTEFSYILQLLQSLQSSEAQK